MTSCEIRVPGRLVSMCAVLCAASHSIALAETAEKAVTSQAPPMGHGFAYLFGFGAAIVLFVAKLLMTKPELPKENAE